MCSCQSAFTEDHGCGLTCEHTHARIQSGRALKTPSCGFYRTILILNCVLFQLLSTILPRLSIGCYTESLLHSASFLALGSAVINLIGHLPGPLFHL